MSERNIEYYEERKALSEHVYKAHASQPAPYGYEQIAVKNNWKNGFRAAAYKKGNSIIIAFSGTNMDEKPDIKNDIQMMLNKYPAQIDDARAFVSEVLNKNQGCSFSLTGHSLGGSEATIIAVETGLPATTFNAYPVGEIFIKSGVKSRVKDWRNADVVNFVNDADIVSSSNIEYFPGKVFAIPNDPSENPMALTSFDNVLLGNVISGAPIAKVGSLAILGGEKAYKNVSYGIDKHYLKNIGDLSQAVEITSAGRKGWKDPIREPLNSAAPYLAEAGHNTMQAIRGAESVGTKIADTSQAGFEKVRDAHIENAVRQSEIEAQQGKAIFKKTKEIAQGTKDAFLTSSAAQVEANMNEVEAHKAMARFAANKAKEVASDAKALASSLIKNQTPEEQGRAIAQAFQQSKVAPVESIQVNEVHLEKALKIIEKTTNPQNQQEADEVKEALQKLSEVKHMTKHELNNCVHQVSNRIKNENAQRAQQGQPLKTSKDVLVESVDEIVQSSEATARGKRMAETVNIKTNQMPPEKADCEPRLKAAA